MALYRWRRALIAAIVLGGFGLYWASIAFEWRMPLWALALGVVLALAAVSLLSFRPRRSTRSESATLYASDPYSDAYLGRSAPTHPHRDAKPTSQLGPALPDDPLADAIRQKREPEDR
jgi:membrane protein implicated in regulation of membrane protease activity